MTPAGARVVFDRAAIDAAVRRVAGELDRRHGDDDPILLCVLLGALPFTRALHSTLTCRHSLDSVQVSRYRDGVDGGELEWLQRPSKSLFGRTVVIVDDVLDEGYTLAAIRAECQAAGARDVTAAVLVNKSVQGRPAGAAAEFVGLEAGNEFLFGFGMDYRGHHRALPDIYRMETEADDD